MFKLIKIENSGVNVPEPILLAKDTDTKIAIGSALCLENGKAVACQASAAPTYISYENAPAEASEVLCYRVSADMLFEVPVSGTPAALNIGDKLTLDIDDDGCTTLVSISNSGSAEIVELLGAKAIGDKITVRF